MAKFIGVKMIEAVPMTAEEAIKNHYIEKAKDQIWSGLGFVLQWAINGLKKK